MPSSSTSSLVTGAVAVSAAVITAVGLRRLAAQKKSDSVASSVQITLPSWLHQYEASLQGKTFSTDEEMMEVAVEISARNVSEGTGGPFGCAIFERTITQSTGTTTTVLYSVGANRVTTLNNSTLHGEMVAIQFAQKKLKHFSMRQAHDNNNNNNGIRKEYILCTSCEPCAMCLGGTLWSGVNEIICAATKADAEAIGFNEGPVFEESYKALEKDGIRVKRKILSEPAARVLQKYGETGVIYNS